MLRLGFLALDALKLLLARAGVSSRLNEDPRITFALIAARFLSRTVEDHRGKDAECPQICRPCDSPHRGHAGQAC